MISLRSRSKVAIGSSVMVESMPESSPVTRLAAELTPAWGSGRRKNRVGLAGKSHVGPPESFLTPLRGTCREPMTIPLPQRNERARNDKGSRAIPRFPVRAMGSPTLPSVVHNRLLLAEHP